MVAASPCRAALGLFALIAAAAAVRGEGLGGLGVLGPAAATEAATEANYTAALISPIHAQPAPNGTSKVSCLTEACEPSVQTEGRSAVGCGGVGLVPSPSQFPRGILQQRCTQCAPPCARDWTGLDTRAQTFLARARRPMAFKAARL